MNIAKTKYVPVGRLRIPIMVLDEEANTKGKSVISSTLKTIVGQPAVELINGSSSKDSLIDGRKNGVKCHKTERQKETKISENNQSENISLDHNIKPSTISNGDTEDEVNNSTEESEQTPHKKDEYHGRDKQIRKKTDIEEKVETFGESDSRQQSTEISFTGIKKPKTILQKKIMQDGKSIYSPKSNKKERVSKNMYKAFTISKPENFQQQQGLNADIIKLTRTKKGGGKGKRNETVEEKALFHSPSETSERRLRNGTYQSRSSIKTLESYKGEQDKENKKKVQPANQKNNQKPGVHIPVLSGKIDKHSFSPSKKYSASSEGRVPIFYQRPSKASLTTLGDLSAFKPNGDLKWQPQTGDIVWSYVPGCKGKGVAIILDHSAGININKEIYRVAFINDHTHAAVTIDRLEPFDGEIAADSNEQKAKHIGKLVRKIKGNKNNKNKLCIPFPAFVNKFQKQRREAVRDALRFLDGKGSFRGSHNFVKCDMCRHTAEPEFWNSQKIHPSEIERGKHDSEPSDTSDDSEDDADIDDDKVAKYDDDSNDNSDDGHGKKKKKATRLARTPEQRRTNKIPDSSADMRARNLWREANKILNLDISRLKGGKHERLSELVSEWSSDEDDDESDSESSSSMYDPTISELRLKRGRGGRRSTLMRKSSRARTRQANTRESGERCETPILSLRRRVPNAYRKRSESMASTESDDVAKKPLALKSPKSQKYERDSSPGNTIYSSEIDQIEKKTQTDSVKKKRGRPPKSQSDPERKAGKSLKRSRKEAVEYHHENSEYEGKNVNGKRRRSEDDTEGSEEVQKVKRKRGRPPRKSRELWPILLEERDSSLSPPVKPSNNPNPVQVQKDFVRRLKREEIAVHKASERIDLLAAAGTDNRQKMRKEKEQKTENVQKCNHSSGTEERKLDYEKKSSSPIVQLDTTISRKQSLRDNSRNTAIGSTGNNHYHKYSKKSNGNDGRVLQEISNKQVNLVSSKKLRISSLSDLQIDKVITEDLKKKQAVTAKKTAHSSQKNNSQKQQDDLKDETIDELSILVDSKQNAEDLNHPSTDVTTSDSYVELIKNCNIVKPPANNKDTVITIDSLSEKSSGSSTNDISASQPESVTPSFTQKKINEGIDLDVEVSVKNEHLQDADAPSDSVGKKVYVNQPLQPVNARTCIREAKGQPEISSSCDYSDVIQSNDRESARSVKDSLSSLSTVEKKQHKRLVDVSEALLIEAGDHSKLIGTDKADSIDDLKKKKPCTGAGVENKKSNIRNPNKLIEDEKPRGGCPEKMQSKDAFEVQSRTNVSDIRCEEIDDDDEEKTSLTTCSVCSTRFDDKWPGEKWEKDGAYCVDCAFVCVCGVLVPYSAAYICQEKAFGPYCSRCWEQPQALGCNCETSNGNFLLPASQVDRRWQDETISDNMTNVGDEEDMDLEDFPSTQPT